MSLQNAINVLSIVPTNITFALNMAKTICLYTLKSIKCKKKCFLNRKFEFKEISAL